MKAFLKRYALQFCVFLILTAISAFVAWVAGIPLIAAAAYERGYEGAYGGEWLAIFVVFILTFRFVSRKLQPP